MQKKLEHASVSLLIPHSCHHHLPSSYYVPGAGSTVGHKIKSLPSRNLQFRGCSCNCILQKPTCCLLTIMSRFFKNHFQMVWGEGHFLSELPREAPEVGGLDNIDPGSSIICWLSSTAVLQFIHRRAAPSRHGGEIKGSREGPSRGRRTGKRPPAGPGTETVSASWRKVALASCRLGVGTLRQNRGCWLALQLPYPTLEGRFGTKGTLCVQACLPPGVWTWEMSVIFFLRLFIYLFYF